MKFHHWYVTPSDLLNILTPQNTSPLRQVKCGPWIFFRTNTHTRRKDDDKIDMSTLSNTSELNHPMNTSDITENTGNSPDDKVDAIQKIVVTATPGLTVTASKTKNILSSTHLSNARHLKNCWVNGISYACTYNNQQRQEANKNRPVW